MASVCLSSCVDNGGGGGMVGLKQGSSLQDIGLTSLMRSMVTAGLQFQRLEKDG